MSFTSDLGKKQLHEASRKELETLRYARNALVAGLPQQKNIAPEPALFTGLTSHTFPAIPNYAQCAVHLELLQAFHALRLEVNRSTALDECFGIRPNPRFETRRGKLVQIRDDSFEKRRREKWPLFIKLAVIRFLFWTYGTERSLEKEDSVPWMPSPIFPPPIDILIVWHGFLLNPLDYRLFCERNQLSRLMRVDFPWASIHAALNADDWSYPRAPSQDRDSSLDQHFNLAPDLFSLLTESTEREALKDFAKRKDVWNFNVLTLSWDQVGRDRDLERYYTYACDNGLMPQYLVEAVDRQQSFVRKMDQQLWIRSPVVEGTLRRAIARYLKLLKLFKNHPKETLVPTTDIDLVWHTHQCSSERYKMSIEAQTGRFVNHNDKLGAPVLSNGLQRTKQLWRMRYSEEYVRCLCWDCEAILSAVEQAARSGLSPESAAGAANKIAREIEMRRALELSSRSL